MGILSGFRKWLDGDDGVIESSSVSERELTEWDAFFVKIAREVEAVMRREMFTPPGGGTYLPGEYVIYMSKEDDSLWQGKKRLGLQEGLRNSLAQRAREIVGDKTLATQKIALTLSIDGTLGRGDIRVQAVWEDDSPKTQVMPRAKAPQTAPRVPPERITPPPPPPTANTEASLELKDTLRQLIGDAPTKSQPENGEEDKTVVRPRAPIFTLMYNGQDHTPEFYKSYKSKIVIGRGAKDFPVDIKLEGDQEISRKQVVLEKTESGAFKVECVGRNSIEIDGREINAGESVVLEPGQSFRVGLYELKISE